MIERQALRAWYLADEAQAVERLLTMAQWQAGELAKVDVTGRHLIEAIRSGDGVGLLDAFLQEYSLSSEEGIALMCLAEALMRVPDAETLDALIYDKFGRARWKSHLGQSDSFWVNAATWGMLFTGKVMRMGRKDEERLGEKLESMLRNMSEPLIRKAVTHGVKIMGQQFILGEDIESAMKRGEKQEEKGYRYSFDMLGEGARTERDAERYFQSYVDALEAIGLAQHNGGPIENSGLSVKLSAIYPRYEVGKREACVKKLTERMLVLCEKAKKYRIGLTIDAEEAWRLELSMDVIEALCKADSIKDWQGLGLAVQAYQKRCPALLDWLIELGTRYKRRFMVRLVKGAYWDSEIKWYQEQGLENYPVFTRKENTDVSYLACARKMLAAPDAIYPQFATHNAHTVAAILAMADGLDVDFEMQRLHGMGEVLHAQFVEHGQRKIPSRIYAPVGTHKDLLSYLVRRLLENGANSSFVHHLGDEDISIDDLLADPVAIVAARSGDEVANPNIPLPADIFPQRRNAKGMDLTHIPVVESVRDLLAEGPGDWQATSLVKDYSAEDAQGHVVFAPADRKRQIGRVFPADEAVVKQAIKHAEAAFSGWSVISVRERAALLRKLADAYEAHMDDWLCLCVFEAGKIWSDAVAEVREAVDFCRYYAVQAENNELEQLQQARGVWGCISPWNFPLAIFTGQIAAAIVTGNTVVAKPAQQTPLIAHFAVKLMYEVGIPRDVVQLVLGGAEVGAALTENPAIAGVAFTGSTATAAKIQATLLSDGKERTLIAETGGQNAMIVDSTALPEQVVDAVMTSAFQSAGQRCSALRVLCLQEDIYDETLDMIKGALKTRSVGDTVALSVDIGPVIDQAAYDKLEAYVAGHSKRVLVRHEGGMPSYLGFFVAPTILEISDVSELSDEQFGPILHVVRFQADELDALISAINGLGYGLTGCLHSRIETRQQWFIEQLHVGNVYINRNQIGAIVGSQPFGGHGLSGTGPKAGGPQYLPRFVTVNDRYLLHHDFSGNAVMVERSSALADMLKAQHAWAQLAPQQAVQITASLRNSLSHLGVDVPAWFGEALTAIAEAAVKCQEVINMPGVTGEQNQWRCYARGVILQMHEHADSRALLQIVVALLTGNAVLAVGLPQAWYDWLIAAGVPKEVLCSADDSEQLVEQSALCGLMLSGSEQWCAPLRDRWLMRKGAIVPVFSASPIMADQVGHIQMNPDALSYLMFEQSISINTAAAGGNIELLSL
ncbi:bifunctional proline dehydrogenase/L-glutamate gamma-semialdehyde dehydrogenase PutA [Cardiobacteriaceae bacterium TAE3-ERU3]|nr:bifunctional proline dehydrogenase/L-glutamate gamma-semialdehyde dehydrogenase PutA [Cardiobacteriaceae bacterium TAE3-ERU3]